MSDAAKLAEFDEICFGSEGMTAEEWGKVLDERSHVVQIERNGEVAGISVVKWDAGIGYLYSNAVLPDYRGQGIGTNMIRARLEFVRGMCHIVQTHTRIGNEPSQSALRKCGFQPIQYVPDFYDEFEDAILWEIRKW